MNNARPIGVYIHVPFCGAKCPYCDFYSLPGSAATMDAYVSKVCETIEASPNVPADTLYFGGGTPSLLGVDRLARCIAAAKRRFLLQGAEITVEANPNAPPAFFRDLAQTGTNRVSLGMQSIHPAELQALGRRHTAAQVREAIRLLREGGITNLSLDLMLAIPHQTKDSLRESIAFCAEENIPHISAYLLKIEPGTEFFCHKDALAPLLPSDDETADRYLFAVEELAKHGYLQYEISNFCREGQISRHNCKYWQGEEYLGIGPSAHSYLAGKRFYFPQNLRGFLDGAVPVDDGEGGSREEFAMLALRLCTGLTQTLWQERFGEPLPAVYLQRAKKFAASGLVRWSPEGFSFTPKGFLVSNALLAEILG